MSGTVNPGDAPMSPEDLTAAMLVLKQEYQQGLLQLEALKSEMALTRVTSGHAASSSGPLPAACKAAPPANFFGKKDGESIESWLFSLEQYFDMKGLREEGRKVQYAGSLLRGPALVWFRTMCSTPEHLEFIKVWSTFCSELKANFRPSNLIKLARDRLAYMRQSGPSVREYIREFRTVCLDIPSMSADEKLDRFTRGLKSHIRREVELKEPTTFDEAVKLAEKLDSAQRSSSSSYQQQSGYSGRTSGRYSDRHDSDGPAPMDLNAVHTHRPPPQHRQGQRMGHNRSQSPGRPQFTRLTPELRAKLMAEGKCLYCREAGHFIDNCPKRSGPGNGRRPATPGPRR